MLSKTATMRKARAAVGHPIRVSSTSYHVYGPYHCAEPAGPSTQGSYGSYWAARQGRAIWVAQVALALMGDEWGNVDAIAQRHDSIGAEALVKECLNQ